MPTQFEFGFLVGLLVGEGHFGGDGRQPQVTLRMHVRHEAMFRWLEQTFPGGRLYGPYNHGGRHYLQWMARGPFLRDELVPVLDRLLSPSLDRHSFDRVGPRRVQPYGAPLRIQHPRIGQPHRLPAPTITMTPREPPQPPRPATTAARIPQDRQPIPPPSMSCLPGSARPGLPELSRSLAT